MENTRVWKEGCDEDEMREKPIPYICPCDGLFPLIPAGALHCWVCGRIVHLTGSNLLPNMHNTELLYNIPGPGPISRIALM
jgi:hypothetical protein